MEDQEMGDLLSTSASSSGSSNGAMLVPMSASSSSSAGVIPSSIGMSTSIPIERSYGDLEAWLSKLSTGTPLAESEVKSLCDLGRETLLNESNVQPVPAPVTVCGDIHGQ